MPALSQCTPAGLKVSFWWRIRKLFVFPSHFFINLDFQQFVCHLRLSKGISRYFHVISRQSRWHDPINIAVKNNVRLFKDKTTAVVSKLVTRSIA